MKLTSHLMVAGLLALTTSTALLAQEVKLNIPGETAPAAATPAAAPAATMAPAAAAVTEQTGVLVTRTVVQGDTVAVGACTLEVIALAGHTPGSIALLYDDPDGRPHLFTGDSLFPGGVGNTFGDAEAFTSLFGDVSEKLFARLPDETWFYPGHGNDSTLGVERPHLEEWRERGW